MRSLEPPGPTSSTTAAGWGPHIQNKPLGSAGDQGVAQQFAGRVLRQCQPDQGAMVSTWQKATAPLSSALGTAGTAAQTALVGTRCQCRVAAENTAVGVCPGGGTSLFNDRMGRSRAQLTCTCTDARSMGNKQEQLEAIVQQENYDIVPITEMCGDGSNNGTAVMGGIDSSEGIGTEGVVVG